MATSQRQATAPMPAKMAKFAAGYVGASWAEMTSLPLDTAKVRMQMDTARVMYTSPWQTVRAICKRDGLTALWGGLPAGILRAGTMYATRLASFDIALAKTVQILEPSNRGTGSSSVYVKMIAAIPCTVLSVLAANPFDVLKVRAQHAPAKFSSISWRTVSHIIRSEGLFKGMYSGLAANVGRNVVVGGAELVGYFQTKQVLMHTYGFGDNTATHVLSSLGAAVTAVALGSPFDLIGTRMMQPEYVSKGRGVLGVVGDTLRNEGFRGLYKGAYLSLGRVWTFNLVLWLTYENVTRMNLIE
jgi:hypothetical protein